MVKKTWPHALYKAKKEISEKVMIKRQRELAHGVKNLPICGKPMIEILIFSSSTISANLVLINSFTAQRRKILLIYMILSKLKCFIIE